MIKYHMLISVLVLFTVLLHPAQVLAAGSYGYSEDKEVIGMTRYHRVNADETMYEIARVYNLGYSEVKSANPDVKNPFKPGLERKVLLPTKWILPSMVRDYDIVVNLAEMRLYRFFSSGHRRLVSSYPIGVAIDGFFTPLGSFSVSDKLVRPYWYVPDSVRKEQPELPPVVPPGEENPLGEYALRLSDSHYFIHGTNKPYGIGMRVSHGCIRLYPEDIGELHSIVELGASVNIVYEPVKVGARAGNLFMEVHDDYLEKVEDMHALADEVLRKKGYIDIAEAGLVSRAVDEKLGIPVIVGKVDDGSDEVVEVKAEKNPEPEAPGKVSN